MTCIYCDGETDTSGACVAQCYWSQNKRWNTRPIEDALRAELEKRTAELHYANTACIEMKHELARLKAERRWIPVSERLPLPAKKADGYMSDSSELVHVYPPPRNDRGVCYLHYLGKWSCSAEVNVTHWMPLPPPPEEE